MSNPARFRRTRAVLAVLAALVAAPFIIVFSIAAAGGRR